MNNVHRYLLNRTVLCWFFASLVVSFTTQANEPGHAGFVSIFDGKSLDGWEGKPEFWRVEDGAIVGETTAENP
ncbi:MAG: hypothetical protein RLZZ622_1372, partial [Planctomycetota bacterium]